MTSVGPWQRHDILGTVLVILRNQRNSRGPELPDGYPFLSAYQLAILLDESHPEIRQELGMPIGGHLVSGEQNRGSLAQMLAGELSRLLSNRHNDERINRVERAFLSGACCNISFDSSEGPIEPTDYPLSMFRYRPEP